MAHKHPYLMLVNSEEINKALEDDEEEGVEINEGGSSSPCPSVDMFEEEEREEIERQTAAAQNLYCNDPLAIQEEFVTPVDPDPNVSVDAGAIDVNAGATDFNSDSEDSLINRTPTPLVDVSSDSEEELTVNKTKPKAEIWSKFLTQTNKSGKIVSNTCQLCGSSVSAKAYRMRKHYENCLIKSKPKVVKRTVAQASFAEQANAPLSTASTSGLKQSSMKTFTTAITSQKKTDLDLQLGRFVFSTDLSFNVIRSPQFKKFVGILNPAYVPPSYATLGSSILESVYTEVRDEMASQLNQQNVCILQDGWSTNQNTAVISHCATTLNNNYFLGAEDTGIEKKTGEFCFNLLEQAITKAEYEYKCKVVGVVTDNCNTMLSLHRQCQIKYPKLHVYGCNSHLLNLLGKHFTNSAMQSKVSTVQNFMRNHQYTRAALKASRGKQPVLPGSTRWNSQIDSFLNYCENHGKYLEILRKYKLNITKQELEKVEPVMTILNEGTLYEEIQTSLRILKPICLGLDKLQAANCSIATAIHTWLDLCLQLPADIVQDSYFEKQKELGLTKVGIAAYMLHPKYKGNDLPDDLLEIGTTFISAKDSKNIIALAGMKTDRSKYFFSAYMNTEVCKTMDPVAWWSAAATSAVPESLKELAKQLLVLPASTGSIERNFSTLGNIMSKQRNRLSVDKASKLCTIHNFYNMQQNQENLQKGVHSRQPKRRKMDHVDEDPASG